ncbi:Putative peptidoglycan binding domain-containing protein [Sarcina sp. DSM 11001]|uniref:L,D-transpeptidase family protein n=1 Tax=Sarcina sp. DSM 11001 TaxID=1798184 RepID=UPI000880EBFC|nr:L,D-transpeptidase family protein [Sarcina sp. DSM 11001]SDL09089.1 Putative peptidoglycan binding domain-containing protein [Sarcina sp. DSM 11001]
MIKNKTNPTDTELKVPAETGEETANAESGTGEQTTAEGSGSGEQTIVAGSEAPESEAPEAGSLTDESPTDDSVSAAPSEVPEGSPSGAGIPESNPSEAEASDGAPSEAGTLESSQSDAAAPENESSSSETTPSETPAPENTSPEAETPESSPSGVSATENESSPSQVQTPGSEIPAVEDPEEKKKKKKKRRSLLAFWLSFLILAGALGGIYYYGYQYCQTHFMPGTTINGYDCSDMTVDEAQRWFDIAAKNYVMNIRFRGGATETLSAEDMGFSYQPDGSIDVLLQNQDETFWPKYYLEENHYTITPTGTYDPDVLEASLRALPELQEENMILPEDAYIQFRDGTEDTDGEFVIVPDVKGSTIDLDQLAAGVGDAAARYEEMVDAEEIPYAYKTAGTQADDAKLVARCMDLNDMVGASLTYVMPDKEEIRLNSDILKDWLVKDKKGRLVKDEEIWKEKISDFVQTLADNGNTVGMKRHFNATLQGPIVVEGGFYGYAVDQEAERNRLAKDLENCVKDTRTPIYWNLPYNEETEYDGIGTTYIEADLSAQHVWCYIQGRLVMDCDCVSGTMNDGHATLAGVHGIMFKKRNALLQGLMPNSSTEYEYETEVKYWMPFYTDVGFHDAWWRADFGGDIYLKDGSHGCINLPPEAAEELFSYCDENMPVVVYY